MVGSEGSLGLLQIFQSFQTVNWTQVFIGGTATHIGRHLFEKNIRRHSSFQLMLFAYYRTRIRQISQRAVCNACYLIEQRFCSWLLML